MDISRIFNSKTRTELFRVYFSNPEAKYYLRELERLLSIPVSMIRSELNRLVQDGVFVSKRQGNLVYYSLNTSYPLYNELKSIVFKTIGIQGTLAEKLKKIKGIQCAFIYGSFAKDTAGASSDVDVCIIGGFDEDTLVRVITRLERMLSREINYSLYSAQEFQEKHRGKDPFIMDILANPKIFLVGNEHDL